MRYFKIVPAVLMGSLLFGAALVGCGHNGQNPQSQVDAANADLARMGEIDQGLRAQGVFINSEAHSQAALNHLDAPSLRNVDALLLEFIRRGRNVLSTAHQRDVSYPEADQKRVAAWIHAALLLRGQIHDQANRVFADDGTSNRCSNSSYGKGASISTARRYVQSLGKGIEGQVDWTKAKTSLNKKSCDLVVIDLPHQGRSECRLQVTVKNGKVDRSRSEKKFNCR